MANVFEDSYIDDFESATSRSSLSSIEETWPANNLNSDQILIQANLLRKRKQDKKKVKWKYFNLWRTSTICSERNLQRKAAQSISNRFALCFVRCAFSKWKTVVKRSISSTEKPSNNLQIRFSLAKFEATKRELEEARSEIIFLAKKAEELLLSNKKQEGRIKLFQHRIYLLILQRYFLLCIIFIFVPSLALLLASHYYDFHDWEVSTSILVSWLFLISGLLILSLYFLAQIRNNVLRTSKRRAPSQNQKTDNKKEQKNQPKTLEINSFQLQGSIRRRKEKTSPLANQFV